MHNLDLWDERDKAISTRAYAFNGRHLDYYVASNYRWQIYYAEIKLSAKESSGFPLLWVRWSHLTGVSWGARCLNDEPSHVFYATARIPQRGGGSVGIHSTKVGWGKTCNHFDCNLLGMAHFQGQAYEPGSSPSYNVWKSLQSTGGRGCGKHTHTRVQTGRAMCILRSLSTLSTHTFWLTTAALGPSQTICQICSAAL